VLPLGTDALVVSDAPPAREILEAFERIAVLLDAGYYLPPRESDWLPARVRSHIGIYLVQYGNVGPLTVAHLAEATITAASR
jgi:hypothetical protein